jgi:hypothetical protein
MLPTSTCPLPCKAPKPEVRIRMRLLREVLTVDNREMLGCAAATVVMNKSKNADLLMFFIAIDLLDQ